MSIDYDKFINRDFLEEHLKIAFSRAYNDEKRNNAYRLLVDVLVEKKINDEAYESDINAIIQSSFHLLNLKDGQTINFLERAMYDWYHNNDNFEDTMNTLEKKLLTVSSFSEEKFAKTEKKCFDDVKISSSTKERFLREAKLILTAYEFNNLKERLELFISIPAVKEQLVLFDNALNLNCYTNSIITDTMTYLKYLAPFPKDFLDPDFKAEWKKAYEIEQEKLNGLVNDDFGLFLSEFNSSSSSITTYVKMGLAYQYASENSESLDSDLSMVSKHFFLLGALENKKNNKIRRRN